MLNTLVQTVEVSIAPPGPHTSPAPPQACRHSHPYQEYSDINISEANLKSNEEIKIVSYWLAPGPSGDGNIISKRAPESDTDSEDSDIIVSWFQLSSRFVPNCQQTEQLDTGQMAASGVTVKDHI